MKADLLFDTHCALAEGPVWHGDKLTWVDIENRRLHRAAVGGGEMETLELPSRVGFALPRQIGGWVLGLEDGLHTIDDDFAAPNLTPFAKVDHAGETARLNDGKPDPSGRVWFGTMGMGKKPNVGALYRVSNQMIERVIGDIGTSNGLAWSADGRTMYYIDTPTGRVDAFTYDPADGTIDVASRRGVYSFTKGQGHPDGMAIDSAGRLWVGTWAGHAVLCVDPATGKLVDRIDLPVANVTSCCFGGKDLDQLFITTASVGLNETQRQEQPHAGGIFVATPGVSGAAVPACVI